MGCERRSSKSRITKNLGRGIPRYQAQNQGRWPGLRFGEYDLNTSESTRQNFYQAQQRVSDSWRSKIGSTGLMVVNSFFEAKDELTDEGRRQIAREGLRHNRFLYSNVTSDDPLVSRFHVVILH
jgi:hypothetical protein